MNICHFWPMGVGVCMSVLVYTVHFFSGNVVLLVMLAIVIVISSIEVYFSMDRYEFTWHCAAGLYIKQPDTHLCRQNTTHTVFPDT